MSDHKVSREFRVRRLLRDAHHKEPWNWVHTTQRTVEMSGVRMCKRHKNGQSERTNTQASNVTCVACCGALRVRVVRTSAQGSLLTLSLGLILGVRTTCSQLYKGKTGTCETDNVLSCSCPPLDFWSQKGLVKMNAFSVCWMLSNQGKQHT